VNGTGTAPAQVPYVPASKGEVTGTEDISFTRPGEGAAPGTQAPSEDLLDKLKAKYIEGGVSEDTYIAMKKKIKEQTSEGGSGQVDEAIRQFIMGEITEDDYKSRM
jgi:hypothetical protein